MKSSVLYEYMKKRGNLKSTNKRTVFETRTVTSRVSYIANRCRLAEQIPQYLGVRPVAPLRWPIRPGRDVRCVLEFSPTWPCLDIRREIGFPAGLLCTDGRSGPRPILAENWILWQSSPQKPTIISSASVENDWFSFTCFIITIRFDNIIAIRYLFKSYLWMVEN